MKHLCLGALTLLLPLSAAAVRVSPEGSVRLARTDPEDDLVYLERYRR